MPASMLIRSRQIAVEDLALTTDPDGETFQADVKGLGLTTLNKLSPILLTSLQQATDALVAQQAGVDPGQLYYNTTFDFAAANILPQREIPSGAISGSNTVFALQFAPLQLALYRNGMLLRQGAGWDYTLSGPTITMLSKTGTVSTVGQIVNRVSGDAFRPNMVGNSILINSVAYQVVAYLGDSQLFLSASAGTQSNVSYSASGAPRIGDTLEAIYWR